MPGTQEELTNLYIKIQADVKDLRRELTNLKGTLDRDSQKMGTSFGENLGKTSGSSFGRVFGGYLLRFASVAGLGKFISDSVKAFSEQEDAEKKLLTQLGYTNRGLLDQASALQSLTKYGDESIIKAQALIAAFTKDEGQIKQLTEVTLDLAEGLGMDLNSAAQLVAKSFGSSTNALARYGINIEGTAGSSERLKQLTDEITRLFGGQAAAAANTFSGRVQNLKNRFGDLQEQIGKFLIPALDTLVTKFGGIVSTMDKIGNSKVFQFLWEGLPINQKDQITDDEFVKKWNDTVKNAKFKIGSGQDIYLLKAETNELKAQRNELEEILKAKLKAKDFKAPVDSTENGGSSKDDFKFSSAIPKGYTAAQVAEYESLKFAAKGYVDFAIAEIQRKYKVEFDEAKGNVERINQAEENRKLALARLNQEMIEIEKDGSETTEKVIQDSLDKRSKELEENLFNEGQLENDSYQARQEAINNFYDAIGVKSEEYFQNKIKRIQDEANAIAISTENNALAKEYELTKLKELEQEYFDWKIEQWKQQNQVGAAAMESMQSTMVNTFHRMQIKVRQDASILEQTFADMANAFIREVERMIAEWLSFQLLKGIIGVIAAPFTGGASAVAAVAAHSGGNFVGTNQGVMKLAAGGDFIVPRGYPNDSYPLMVESGERVSVTSAGGVGSQDRLLTSIDKRLQKLEVINRNLISKDFSPVIVNSMTLNGRTIAKEVISDIKTMQKEGRKF